MEGIQYVYFEKVLALNTVMNCLIIAASLRICNRKAPLWRIFAAAVLGGLYSFSLLVPDLTILTGLVVKSLFSLLMLAIVLVPCQPLTFAKVGLTFYLVAFALGGAMLALGFMSNQPIGAFLAEHLWWMLALGMLLTWAGGRIIPAMQRLTAVERTCLLTCKICFGEQLVEVTSFLDTGNTLCDPISGHPVVVVEQDILLPTLPVPLQEVLLAEGNLYEQTFTTGDSQWDTRWRLIPYSAVGTGQGIMLGLKPDYIEYEKDGETVREVNVVIGLHQGQLAPEQSFQALFNPQLVL